MLTISGVVVTAPFVFRVVISDLDGESGRNARGQLIRDRVAVKRKLECEWGPLKNHEISAILQSVKDEFFQVEYPDPMTGTMQTKTFYVGDRPSPALYQESNGQMLWHGLNMNLIER